MPAGQAVEELISKYSKLVFHTIYAMTGDWEESQDLTQDTFHQALKGINAARAARTASGSEFREKAWLLRIALNTFRMQRRRRNLFRFIPFSHMQKGNQAGQLYALESGERISDSETSAATIGTIPGTFSRQTGKHEHSEECVEDRAAHDELHRSLFDAHPSILGRNYAEGLS